MEKPRKQTSNILYNDGWNDCHDAMSTWIEGAVPSVEDIYLDLISREESRTILLSVVV